MVKRVYSTLLICSLLFAFFSCSKFNDDYSLCSSSPTATSEYSNSISSKQNFSSSVSFETDSIYSTENSSYSNSTVSNIKFEDKTLDTTVLDTLPNIKSGWGPGYGKNGAQPPINAKNKALLANYGAYCIGAPDDNNIYLTFDCGYEGGYTETILDTLKSKDVKAVFFITLPYAKKNAKIVQRILDEGHIIGNHTNTHPSLPGVTLDKLELEIEELDKYVIENFNYKMTLFRFPQGEYSERTLAAIQQLGYHSVFWSFAYLDYDVNNQKGTSYALDMITSKAHKGAIYLLHPQSKDNNNALSDAIDFFNEKGYQVAQLTDGFVQIS